MGLEQDKKRRLLILPGFEAAHSLRNYIKQRAACTLLFYLSVFFEKTLPKKGRLPPEKKPPHRIKRSSVSLHLIQPK